MKKINDYLAGIIFVIVGVIFLNVSLIFNYKDNEFIKKSAKVVGVIEDINIDYGFDDDTYDIYISYKDLNGEYHRGKSNYSSNTMRIGDRVDVYYDINNPSSFIIKPNDYFNYIFFGMSSLFILLGGLLIVIPIIKKKNGLKLIDNGIKLNATISSVAINSGYQVNGKSPYVINVSFIYQDLMYEAKSNNIWYDAEYIINNYNIKELPIYIEINNPKKYYLDTSELEKYVGK